jgi:membrane-bound serine protease (ClpP class)
MTYAILLLALGLAFVIAEVLIPSFGALSILATLAILGAIALAFREGTHAGLRFLVAVALSLPATILFALKVLPRSPFGRRMVSRGLSFESVPTTDPRDALPLGTEGEIEAACRPAGMARLAGRRVDVVTRGEWIEAGERVRVAEVEGNRVVVVRVGDGAHRPH